MIKIHREGRVIVAITIALVLVLVFVSAQFLPWWMNYLSAIVSVVILGLVLWFFRLPTRRPFLEDKTIVAPADGKIVAIELVQQEEFLQTEAIQVSIFMSIHDVHVNYFPVQGKITYLKYHPGRYMVARHPKSSTLNESYSMGIETSYGAVLVRQIAGYVARRIRCYAKEDGIAIQGKEMGFIKFGSRLDLFLPPDVSIQVKKDQHVTGSVTPIARFK
jgi:phosphatidylserine decarboxylase